MKKSGFLMALLTIFLLVGVMVLPTSATSIPSGCSSSYYSEFAATLTRLANSYPDKFYIVEWVDFSGDGISEMLVSYNPDRSDYSYTVEIYQYDSTTSHVKCVYHHKGTIDWLAFASLGTLDGRKTLNFWNGEDRGGVISSDDTYVTFDENMNSHVTQLSYAESVGHGFGPVLVLGTYYSLNGATISEDKYNDLTEQFSHFSKQQYIGPDYATDNNLSEWNPRIWDKIRQLNKFATDASQQESLSALEKGLEDAFVGRTIANHAETMSEDEKKEMVDYMGFFESWEFTGEPPSLVSAMYAMYYAYFLGDEADSYFNLRYPHETNSVQTANDEYDTVAFDIDVFQKMTQDVYGLYFPLENIEDETYDTLSILFQNDQAIFMSRLPGFAMRYTYTDLLGLYEISENLYYAVFQVYDFETDNYLLGYSVLEKRYEEDSYIWKCYYTSPTGKALDVHTLKNYIVKHAPEANIVFDYNGLVASTDFSQHIDELRMKLESVDGVLNDKALASITDFLNYSLQKFAVTSPPGRNNRFAITGKALESATSTLVENIQMVNSLLQEYAIQLNQPYQRTVRLDVAAEWLEQPIQLTFDETLLDTLQGIDLLIIYLGDQRHALSIGTDQLHTLIGYTIQIQKIGDLYIVAYVNSDGQPVSYLSNAVMLTLPADGELASVLLTHTGGSENWGGQYDVLNQSITFAAPYAGEYSILNEQIALSDIDTLTEEQQKAIRFMVSKGYFTAPEGLFNPAASLTRYDFAETLVRIFFAKEDGLTTTFTDVPHNSPYYSYVASGANKGIIYGYNETTFGGANAVTMQEVLCLCSHTLTEYKDYLSPVTPADYLHFVDTEQIAEWAQESVALSVREALIHDGGLLLPTYPISRADAALILYRLFMQLYEPQPVSIVVNPELDKNIDAPMIAGISIGGLLTVVTAVAIIRKKRNSTVSSAP